MFRGKASRRSIREVLDDRTGSSIAEGLAGIALVMIISGTLAVGVTTDMSAVSTIATKAERQALVTSLVGNKHEGATWGTPAAPTSKDETLPNGHVVKVTMWQDVTPVSTRLTAVTAISADAGATTCVGPSAVEKKGCLYASRLHASELDALEPFAIVKKDPSLASSAIVGSVNDLVSTPGSIPQGATLATGSDNLATVWRYLISAGAPVGGGEIRISQAGKTLAQFPVDAATNNYFGTFTVALNVPVTATVTAGNVVVNTIFFYRAGGTS